jgi:hypothetical protein
VGLNSALKGKKDAAFAPSEGRKERLACDMGALGGIRRTTALIRACVGFKTEDATARPTMAAPGFGGAGAR